MLELIQEVVGKDLEGLDRLLDSVDADFSGANGEEYYVNGVSVLEDTLRIASQLGLNTKKTLEFVLDSCKRYSSNYYSAFKYEVFTVNAEEYLVTIATTMR